MNVILRKFSIIITATMFALWGSFVYAQFIPKAISLSANPVSPSPGEVVTIEAATPLFDKDTANFSWEVNGAPRPEFSGQGKNTISISAGGLGSVLNVTVTVIRGDGPGGRASIAIPIADLALTWFAETHVPKWYRGKALPVENSIVDIIAIPNIISGGERIQSKKLIYHWSLDDQTNLASGVGQDVFRIKTSPFANQTYHINLVIEDINKQIRKEKDLFLITFSPRLVVYPYSPLGGIEFRQGIGYVFSKKDGLLDFIAETFHLPIASPKNLQYAWKVKNASVSGNPENPQLLTIDTVQEQDKQVPISVNTDDLKHQLSPLSYSLFLIRK